MDSGNRAMSLDRKPFCIVSTVRHCNSENAAGACYQTDKHRGKLVRLWMEP